jgi:hypothetical protein
MGSVFFGSFVIVFLEIFLGEGVEAGHDFFFELVHLFRRFELSRVLKFLFLFGYAIVIAVYLFCGWTLFLGSPECINVPDFFEEGF